MITVRLFYNRKLGCLSTLCVDDQRAFLTKFQTQGTRPQLMLKATFMIN